MISDTVTESIKIALEQLHAERSRVNAAILKLETFLSNVGALGPDADPEAIERLALGMPARRKRSTAGWTQDKRRAAAERMRKYWSERRARGEDEVAAGDGSTEGARKRGTAGWTPDKRRAASERMRKYWSERPEQEEEEEDQSDIASS